MVKLEFDWGVIRVTVEGYTFESAMRELSNVRDIICKQPKSPKPPPAEPKEGVRGL